MSDNVHLPKTGNGSQGNYLPGQTPSDWSELPPELLQSVFWILATNNYSSMLTCRLVHPHWRSSADKILEEKCLQIWTKWTPSSNRRADWVRTFPNLQLIATSDETALEWALCPPNLLAGSHNHSPIPTSSLSLHFKKERVLNEDYKVTLVVNLFEKMGHYLTSVEFFDITVSVSVLRSIFQIITNVKAMTVNKIFLKSGYTMDGKNSYDKPLLSLPQLEHYKLMSIREKYYYPNSGYKWLLKSFASQLISLETNEEFFKNLENSGTSEISTRYPNLKQLKITNIPKHYPRRLSAPFLPKLERVSLTLLIEEDSIFEKLMSVLRFLATSANSLNHLHLEFKDWTRNPIDCRQLPQEIAFQFPKLTTLGIFYPIVEGEKTVLKRFLKICPNLQTLKLFRFIKCSERRNHPELKGVNLDTKPLSYRTICQKLKKLTTYSGWDEESVMYTLSMNK